MARPRRMRRRLRRRSTAREGAQPTDKDLTVNLDRYWRGKGGEQGGDAIERKHEKHGENSNSVSKFARTAFAFARANCTRWFYQDPNQIVFHNYDPDKYDPNNGDQVKMVKMVVGGYRVEEWSRSTRSSRARWGGSIDNYMRGIGFVG
jgi:hypothetical protein